ncbi:MAG: S41 family peptidase [Telluria sp.]
MKIALIGCAAARLALTSLLTVGLLCSSPAAAAARDDVLTSQQRTQAIEDIATAFEKIYVFPEVGDAVARDLRQRLQRGDYDKVAGSRQLATLLSAHIDAICHDAHTSIEYMEDDQLAERPTADPAVVKRRAEERRAKAAAENFDFAEPRRLDGNIALIKFDGFYSADLVGPLVQKYMSDAASADALIIDLRENGGGSPQIIALLASYLFDETPVHLYDQINRREGTHVQAWTDPHVPGKRFGSKKPVFVLTSAQTYSAAENLAYTLQHVRGALVVGEKTRGGAHGSFGRPVSSHLVPIIGTSRTVNAVTKSDWDRTGVIPNSAAPAADALDVAIGLARAAINAPKR